MGLDERVVGKRQCAGLQPNPGVPVQISATNFDGTVRAFGVAR